jgi:hypothetical protein
MEPEFRVAIHEIFIVRKTDFAPCKKALCQAHQRLACRSLLAAWAALFLLPIPPSPSGATKPC